MKMVVLGGGGVRAPMLVEAATRRADQVGLTDLWLLDVDRRKLDVFGAVAAQLAQASGNGVAVHASLDADEALDGADYVVGTIRVGGDRSRVLDERIALSHGVLGQETTGAGGFAMAMRTIPALLGYADKLRHRSPDAWLLNFTNPAGLVVQGLVDAGFDRVVGICDSANLAQLAVAASADVDPGSLRAEVFGLNHLSWTRRVAAADGEDLLADRLNDPGFVGATMQRFFEPALRARTAMWMNEYLFYWYYAEQALAAVSAESPTRGQEIEALNAALIDELERSMHADVSGALQLYTSYEAQRHENYMHYADPGSGGRSLGDSGEGYAGVALDVVEALETGEPLYTALNVRNGHAIEGFEPDDVVEVSCVVDDEGIRPLEIGAIPEYPAALMNSVKRYERLAARAIREQSRELAIDALMAHPLVLSFSRARGLVDDYLEAHQPWRGR